MRTAIAVAALAGSAFAIPSLAHKHKHKRAEVQNVHVVVETVVHTVYVTEGTAAATAAAEQAYEPVVTTVVYEEPAAAASTPQPQAPAQQAYQPAPAAPSPTPQAAAPVAASSGGYQGIVEEWRAKLGLKALTWSQKLESNALNCAQSGNGQMVHKLNPGTYAQVLAPGTADNFESVFVGGWLCEIPTLAGLDGICSSESQGWSYDGQTGHAEILTNPSYGSYGCALADGIWACDLA